MKFIFQVLFILNISIISTYTHYSQSQPSSSSLSMAESIYENLIELTHNIYSSQIILKAKPLNKIKQPSAASSTFSVLLQIEAIYKNNENKNLNLALGTTTTTSSGLYYTKVFLQNITLPIIIKTSHSNRHHQQQQQIKSDDILLNKSYILFLNKNFQQQQHDFYTLINLKSNRYIRERVPKLTLFASPLEWNSNSENFIVNSLCKICGTSNLFIFFLNKKFHFSFRS
jgi:hypothetical protein